MFFNSTIRSVWSKIGLAWTCHCPMMWGLLYEVRMAWTGLLYDVKPRMQWELYQLHCRVGVRNLYELATRCGMGRESTSLMQADTRSLKPFLITKVLLSSKFKSELGLFLSSTITFSFRKSHNTNKLTKSCTVYSTISENREILMVLYPLSVVLRTKLA